VTGCGFRAGLQYIAEAKFEGVHLQRLSQEVHLRFMAKAVWGTPKPRMAPDQGLLVYTIRLRTSRWELDRVRWHGSLPSSPRQPVGSIGPVIAKNVHSTAVRVPPFLAPLRYRNFKGWRLQVVWKTSSRE